MNTLLWYCTMLFLDLLCMSYMMRAKPAVYLQAAATRHADVMHQLAVVLMHAFATSAEKVDMPLTLSAGSAGLSVKHMQ